MPTFREDLHLGHKVPLVDTDDISNGAVTPEKLAPTVPAVVMEPIDNKYKSITDDLQNQINSLEVAGIALSNKFGDNEHIGISQKTLTRAINNIYSILESVTGETYLGFTWQISPSYFVGEESTMVHVTAQPAMAGEVLEHIELSVNGVVIENSKRDYVTSYSFDLELTDTSVIKCTAYVLGVKYEREQEITRYSFWVGAGTNFANIMTESNLAMLPRSEKNITCAAGDNIIVVIGASLRDQFLRADINGVEIPFTETAETVDGKLYKVLTSDNTYSAGTYNIDING